MKQTNWYAIIPTVALLVVAAGAPAHAYNYGPRYKVATAHGGGHDGGCLLGQNRGGQAFFCRKGDVFHLWDLNADGKSLGVRWTTSNGHSGLCRFTGGRGRAGDCDYDFPETTRVSFSLGLCNQTSTVHCRSWSEYTNKTSGDGSIQAG